MYKVKNFFISLLTLASASGIMGSAPEVQQSTLSWSKVATLTLPLVAIGAGFYLWNNYSKKKPLQTGIRLPVTSKSYSWLNIPQEIDDKRWSEWYKNGAMPYDQLERVCQDSYKNMDEFVRVVIEKTNPYLQNIKQRFGSQGYPVSGLPPSTLSWIFPVREVVVSSDNNVCGYYKPVEKASNKSFASELSCTPSGVVTAEIHYPSVTDLDDSDAKIGYASAIMHEMVHLAFLHRAYYPHGAGGKKELHGLEFEADAIPLFIMSDERFFLDRLHYFTKLAHPKDDLEAETDTHHSIAVRIDRIFTTWAAHHMVATGKTKEDAIQHVATEVRWGKDIDGCCKKIVRKWADRHCKGCLRDYVAFS